MGEIFGLKSDGFFKGAANGARNWFSEVISGPTMPVEEAFLAIMVGAARADGVVAPEEAQEIAALCGRTKTLSNLSSLKVHEYQKHIDDKIERDGLEGVLSAAARSILATAKDSADTARLRAESAFAHAVDLVFADREVAPPEQSYIEALARALQIDTERAKAIVQIIEIKNSF